MAIPSEKSELDLNKLNTEFQTNSGDTQTKLSDFYGKTNDLPTSGEIKYSDFFGVDFLPEPPSGTQLSTDWQYREVENDWVDNGVVSGEGKLLISDVSEQSGETISYERFEVVVVGEAGLEWSLDEAPTASYNYTRYTAGDFTDTGTSISWKGWQKSNDSGGNNVETSTPVTEYVTINNYSNFGYTPTDNYDDGYRIYTYDGNENYPATLYHLPGTTYFKERTSTTGAGIGAQEAVTTSNAGNIDYWQGYSGAKYVLQPDGPNTPDENGYYKWVVEDTQGEFWSLGTGANIPLVTRSVGSTDVTITPSNAAENGFTQSNTVDERGYTKWTRDSDSAEFWARDNVFYTKESWTASGSNIFPATNSFTPQDNPGNNYWKDSKYKSYMKTSFTATSNLGNTKTVLFENGDQSWNSNKPLQNDTPQMSPLPSTYARGTVFKYRVDWTWEDYSGGKWLHIRIDDIFYLDHPAYNGTISGDNIKRYIDLTLSDIVNKSFSHAGLTIENYTPSNPSHVKDVTSITFKYQGYRIKVERAELHQSLLSYSVHALKYVPAYGDSEFTIDRLNTPNDAVNTKGHFTFSRGDWKYDKPPDLNRTYNNMMFSFWYNEEFITWDARPRDTNAIWISWWSVVNYKQLGYPHANGTDWAVVKLTPQQIQDGTWVTGNYGEQWRCLDYWTQSIGGSKRNRYNPYYSATTQAADFPTIITHLKIEYQSNNGNIYRYWFKKGNNNLVGDVSGYYSVARWNAGLITRYDEGEAYYALNYTYYDYDYTTASLGGSSSTWEYSTGVYDYRNSETSYYIYENVELTRTVTNTVFVPDGVIYYTQNLNPPTALHTRTGQAGSPSTTVTLTTSNYRDPALSGYNIVKKPGTLQIYTGVEKPFSTSSWSGNINFWKVDITSTGYNYSITVDDTVIITNLSWMSELTAYTHTNGKTYHRGTYQPLISNASTLYFAVRADGFLTEHDWFQGGAPYDYLCIPTGQTGALYTYTPGEAGGTAAGQEYTATEYPDYTQPGITMENTSVKWVRNTSNDVTGQSGSEAKFTQAEWSDASYFKFTVRSQYNDTFATTFKWELRFRGNGPYVAYTNNDWNVSTPEDVLTIDGEEYTLTVGDRVSSADYSGNKPEVYGSSRWRPYAYVFEEGLMEIEEIQHTWLWKDILTLKIVVIYLKSDLGSNLADALNNYRYEISYSGAAPTSYTTPQGWKIYRGQNIQSTSIQNLYEVQIPYPIPNFDSESSSRNYTGYTHFEKIKEVNNTASEYNKIFNSAEGGASYAPPTGAYYWVTAVANYTVPASKPNNWPRAKLRIVANGTCLFYADREWLGSPAFTSDTEDGEDYNYIDYGTQVEIGGEPFQRGSYYVGGTHTYNSQTWTIRFYRLRCPEYWQLWKVNYSTESITGTTGTATWKWEGTDVKTETGVTAPSAGPHALSNKNYYLGTKDTSLSTDDTMYWTIYRTYSETGSDITIDGSDPIRGGNLTFNTIAEGDNYTFTQHTDTKVIRTPLEYIPYTPLFTHADAKKYFYRQFTVADGDAFEDDGTLPEWEVNSSASYNWLENLAILNYELYTVRKNTSNPAGPLISDTSVTATLAPTKDYVTEVNIAQRMNFSIEAPTDDTNSSKIVGYKLVKNQRRFDAGEVVGDETVNLGYIYPEDGTYFDYNGSDKIFVVVADSNGFYRLIWRCYQKTQLSVLGTNQKDHGVWGSTSSVQFSGENASVLNGGLTINVFRFGGSNKIGIDIWLEKRIIHTPAFDTYDTWAVCKCFDIFRYPIGNTTTTSQANSDFIDIFNTDI